MSVPFRVKALYDYASEHEDDLNFDEGQIITVTEEEDDDWYFGEYTDESGTRKTGLFPRNFVERFEPTAPPRPARRAKRDSIEPVVADAPTELESAQSESIETPSSPVVALTFTAPPVVPTSAPAPPPPVPVAVPEPLPKYEVAKEELILTPAPAPAPVQLPVPIKTPAAALPVPVVPKEPEPAVPKVAPPAPVPSTSGPASAPASKPPPPVAGKPSNNAFLQRIAAFNKGGGGPVIPGKPSGANTYIKKPFVAAPPSRDAYVPPARKDFIPTKIYRREEDPEIKEQEAENREVAAKASLLVDNSEQNDDQPKPMSLKERMALLQKQQMEAAQRHADLVSKKEKPKKPVKKPVEVPEAATSESAIADDGIGSAKPSMDEVQPLIPMSPSRRRVSKSIAEASDGNEADLSGGGDTTEGGDDATEKDEGESVLGAPVAPVPAGQQNEEEDEEEDEEEEEEEEEDVDPEVRRKEELRARMAKLSGAMGMPGIGMAGMFGPPVMGMRGPPPIRKKKPAAPKERQSIDENRENNTPSPSAPAVPIPIPGMMGLPGLAQTKRPEEKKPDPGLEVEDEVATPPAVFQVPISPRPMCSRDSADDQTAITSPHVAPGVPSIMPTVPQTQPESRPAPPPPPGLAPPADILSPSPGSASDDEETDAAATRPSDSNASTAWSPLLLPIGSSPRSTAPRIPPLPPTSAPNITEEIPKSPTSFSSRRMSRLPPPIPGVAPAILTQIRAPPPPPLTGAPAIPVFDKHEEDGEEVTEYDGDYDTDIASSAPHRDALRRESNSESVPDALPPLPPTAAHRAVPPPPPVPSSPAPTETRRSIDAPRGAPPLPPVASSAQHNDVPYRPQRQSFSYARQTPVEPMIEEEGVFDPHAQISTPPRPVATAGTPSRSAKQSFDGSRVVRRSIDIGRQSMSVETGYIANDIDMALNSQWYISDNQVPPVFQGRKDILFESEHDTSTNGGAKTIVTRTVYILFQDYSQTILTVKYDPYNPNDVEADQRHENPPRAPRQDQLEDSHERYGKAVAEAAAARKDTIVGDGSPQALVLELLKPYNSLLAPIGTRAYGTQVYSSLGSGASVDQIRPGDIISCRSAKFQGKHGPMHAKYSMEVGKNDYHVAIVAEWDGLKKKVRAWEQGRESKKVKLESFKLDDLRSGEVKVFRVMPRTWVGWSGAK